MTENGNFRVIQTVASGGTAVLYKAIQVSLDRVVAVKRLHPHLTTDDNFTRRFVLEAKAAASLDHENIVRVIDFGIENGDYQIVMEFVEGESLLEILDRWRPINPDIALALVHQICRGLEHAHAKGIVHRDIKPGNVMVTKAGLVKITDFGLAKLTQGGSVHTAAESILGTPLYMSPEQAFGESVDQRSDLFSLGTVLYELLTGRQPFAGENYMGVIQNILKKEIPNVRVVNPDVPEDVESIVERSLARNRDERFQSARAFRESIESLLGHDGLVRALGMIPVLLEHNNDTRLMVRPRDEARAASSIRFRKSPSSAMARRQGPRGPWVAAGAVAVVLASAAGYFLLGPGKSMLTPPTEAPPVQRAALGDAWQPGIIDEISDPATSTGTAAGVAADTVQPGVAAGQSAADTTSRPPPPDPARAAVDPNMPWVNSATASQNTTPQTAAGDAQTQPVVPPPTTTPAQQAAPTPAPQKRAAEPERFQEGFLMVNVEPSGQVYVNGAYRGLANPRLRLTLNAGTHAIECRNSQYESYTETLRIIAGETSQRNVLLKKLRGVISLATQEGAELYVDGTLLGITPVLRPIELDAGTHTLTLKKADYYTWSSQVTVEANATLPLRITLSPRY